jgi:alpha-N-acetylglucosamine transferase
LGQKALDVLKERGIPTLEIPYLLPGTTYSVTESRFNETWSKIHIYALEQFDRIAVLDGDMLVLQNMDELMEISIPDDSLAATHACVCNPRRLSYYPRTWYLRFRQAQLT